MNDYLKYSEPGWNAYIKRSGLDAVASAKLPNSSRRRAEFQVFRKKGYGTTNLLASFRALAAAKVFAADWGK